MRSVKSALPTQRSRSSPSAATGRLVLSDDLNAEIAFSRDLHMKEDARDK